MPFFYMHVCSICMSVEAYHHQRVHKCFCLKQFSSGLFGYVSMFKQNNTEKLCALQFSRLLSLGVYFFLASLAYLLLHLPPVLEAHALLLSPCPVLLIRFSSASIHYFLDAAYPATLSPASLFAPFTSIIFTS